MRAFCAFACAAGISRNKKKSKIPKQTTKGVCVCAEKKKRDLRERERERERRVVFVGYLFASFASFPLSSLSLYFFESHTTRKKRTPL